MKLDIGKFNITSDDKNVTVHERYTKKDGEEGLKFVGYYSTLQGALRGLLKNVINRSDAESVNELLSEIDRHEEHIEYLIDSGDFK